MRVGLNATCIGERPSGAKQRFVGLYGALMRRLPDVEFFLYEPADVSFRSLFPGLENLTIRPTPISSGGRLAKISANLAYWRMAVSRGLVHIFDWFNMPAVSTPARRSVLTIHDLRSLHEGTRVLRAMHGMLAKKSIASVNHLVTVSETMKTAILDRFPDRDVSVVYNGLDETSFRSVSDYECLKLQRKYALPMNFILAVGHLEKRKNYSCLINAIGIMKERRNDCPLLIIGNDSGERNALLKQIDRSGLSSTVVILGNLSDIEVGAAYKLCSLFVFPSIYEGFGIPVLEAMAAHRPMVLSDIPVFREITQESSMYFRPESQEELAYTIEGVLSSANEQNRQIAYGSLRVRDFRFASLAEKLETLYVAQGQNFAL